MDNIEYKGYTIKIDIDENPIDPREDEDFDTMVCFHSRYSLGDKTDLKSDMFGGWDELEKYLKKEKGASVTMPLYLYDHSGISMKTYRHGQHSAWDCGMVGFIYTTKKDIKRFFGNKKLTRAQIEKYLIQEVEIYNTYIMGMVYYFSIEDENGNPVEDGACGNWHDEKDAITEAKSIIDYEVKERNKSVPVGALFN
jgi:hypothetical protein